MTGGSTAAPAASMLFVKMTASDPEQAAAESDASARTTGRNALRAAIMPERLFRRRPGLELQAELSENP